MATVQGQFTDSVTGKPLADVVMDVFPTGDMTGSPVTSYQSNDDGTFNISSSYFDTPGCIVNIEYPGYYQFVGSPSLLSGNVTLTPSQTTQIVSSIPTWVWIAVGLLAAYLGYIYLIKNKKLPI